MVTFSARNTDPEYSLITVNYRSASSLGRMFRSLPPDFFLKGEVIIVNNDPDESGFLRKMFRKTDSVRIVDMKTNSGFSYACNRGAEIGNGSTLFFLNPDTRLLSSSLEPWFQELEIEEKVIIAPILLQNGREEPWSSGKRVSPWRILFQNVFPFPSMWAFFSRGSLAWASGAALALKKKDFDLLGGFDEGYFLYYEDVDFCRRAKEKGFHIQKSEKASFWHYGGGSHCEGKEKQKRIYFHSQDSYVRKYYGSGWCFLFRFIRSSRSLLFF
jgi:N-acetylglucosaminyl-diphospho-decaprenol L-rhamnosyltransferase